jgi:predicted enzyme related to lactoylglutathione lyase
MTINNVLAVAFVADFDDSVAFYERLLGRAPTARPMAGSAIWQLTGSGAVQVNHVPERAGHAAVVIGVEDVDTFAAAARDRGFELVAESEPTGHFRLAALDDPAGNTVTFSETLTPA